MVEERTRHIKDADLEFFPPPAVPGYGNASGFELRVLDRTGRGDVHEMQRVVDQLITDLESRPEIESAFNRNATAVFGGTMSLGDFVAQTCAAVAPLLS